MKSSVGLHHVTAVARDPQKNIDFYQQVLGQRLIKTTVNFDDPGTYHLYYGDWLGSPGTILTFFPWQHVKPGVLGNGETSALSYQIDPQSISFWQARLKQFGFMPGKIESRFESEVIPFQDPEGMRLELVTTPSPAPVTVWKDGPVPPESAIFGFDGVSLWVDEVESTATLLTQVLGYQFIGQAGQRYRYAAPEKNAGTIVDLIHRPTGSRGQFGAGSIHHIAFRAKDTEHQLALRDLVLQHGIGVTEVINRSYFKSIYFRVPAGILFEIATDQPGFSIDEKTEELGQRLCLPPWFEDRRDQIEALLPPIRRTVEPVYK
ncbi:MAG: ring-cleaving dioxygenase [Anaerolineaceae bacterium]|nr:ring-cleaving dioxygenase [Anaerolineaceae bacterium]